MRAPFTYYFHTTARRKGTSSEPVNVAVVSLTHPVWLGLR